MNPSPFSLISSPSPIVTSPTDAPHSSVLERSKGDDSFEGYLKKSSTVEKPRKANPPGKTQAPRGNKSSASARAKSNDENSHSNRVTRDDSAPKTDRSADRSQNAFSHPDAGRKSSDTEISTKAPEASGATQANTTQNDDTKEIALDDVEGEEIVLTEENTLDDGQELAPQTLTDAAALLARSISQPAIPTKVDEVETSNSIETTEAAITPAALSALNGNENATASVNTPSRNLQEMDTFSENTAQIEVAEKNSGTPAEALAALPLADTQIATEAATSIEIPQDKVAQNTREVSDAKSIAQIQSTAADNTETALLIQNADAASVLPTDAEAATETTADSAKVSQESDKLGKNAPSSPSHFLPKATGTTRPPISNLPDVAALPRSLPVLEAAITTARELGTRNASTNIMPELLPMPASSESSPSQAMPSAQTAPVTPSRAATHTETVHLPQLLERVRQALEAQPPGQARHLAFELQPDSLGTVHVDMNWGAEGWKVNWSVSKGDVHDWLIQQMPSLQQQQNGTPIVWNAPTLQSSSWDLMRQGRNSFQDFRHQEEILPDEQQTPALQKVKRPNEYWA